ncbi:MAG: energy transducer TonB [Myxococcota bacterium]|nr:energy transducer TonB [Myxococcota bacterium]
MFEGTVRDTEGENKRQALSMFLSISLIGGTLLALTLVGTGVAEQLLEEEPVEVTFFNAAPPPPPPPPPPGGKKNKKKNKKKKKKKKKIEQPKPELVEPDLEKPKEEEPEPEPEPEEEEPEQEEEIEGGQEGGVIGGVAGGVVGGVVGGVLGGQLGGTGFSAVHWSDVKPKRKVKPKFPQAAKALNIREASCFVHFYIDEKGKPEKVNIEKCASVFHASVEKAAMKWRFYPMKNSSGKRVKASFKLKIKFKLR